MKRMGCMLMALVFLLCGCAGGYSRYAMLRVDLSAEERINGELVTLEERVPLQDAEALYAKVKALAENPKQTRQYGSMPDAIRLYFYSENKENFKQQYFILTKENILYVSYTPLHDYMESYQLAEGAYEAVHRAVFGE